ncbi:hypothetical protein [Neptuniibacter sp. QD37_11]|uniref:hypothetical protein n=1 Tax=Neptuniibacter sp. QD37_11 TaxID=3398209 RepID=UPI0039F57C2E
MDVIRIIPLSLFILCTVANANAEQHCINDACLVSHKAVFACNEAECTVDVNFTLKPDSKAVYMFAEVICAADIEGISPDGREIRRYYGVSNTILRPQTEQYGDLEVRVKVVNPDQELSLFQHQCRLKDAYPLLNYM